MQLPNLRVIGQGVDTEKFRVLGKERNKDLVIVGRIAPVKRLESIIFILTHLNLKYGIAPKVDLYGPISGQDKKYKEHIDHLICEQKLNDQIIFHGPVRQDALPEIFNTHKLLVNFSDTALDRVVVEAMACGLPVFSTNNCVREIIPDAYHDILTCVDQHENHALLAELIYSLLLLPDAIRTHIGRDLREIILHHHSDITLFDRMLAEIGNYEK
ncbi:MAG: glycosyltransferase family 4 protein [Gammaproteobacteria bacterium]|nr:glycosyltransferase family 4 protein [Gammaproteobacteria bacterium]